MPNPKVFKLQKDEFTIPAATQIKPQTQPTIVFERVDGENYELTLTVKMKIVQENLDDVPADINPPGNSYNVLKAQQAQKCKTSKVDLSLTPMQIGGVDDYEIKLDLRMVIPGSKGDHGN